MSLARKKRRDVTDPSAGRTPGLGNPVVNSSELVSVGDGYYVNVKDMLEAGREMVKFIEKVNKVLNDPEISYVVEELDFYVRALDDLLNKRFEKFNVVVEEGRVMAFHEYIPDIVLYQEFLPSEPRGGADASRLADEVLRGRKLKGALAEKILYAMELLLDMVTEHVKKIVGSHL